ncbi:MULTISPECIES: carboxylesterase/lipase family protein [unclassified Streptomyces]|uniref:carboxylesterase/lipase family protein n=1 Tax=unclassified Streptomyces TaxID=2593676 RepID=UPI0035DE2712
MRLRTFPRAISTAITVLLILALTAFASSPHDTDLSPAPPIAVTLSGKVQGTADGNGIRSYKGVPYAATPTGELRWRPPQAAPRWSGVRQATSYGPACYGSGQQVASSLPMSEDCLTLNVWTPTHRGEPRPVMVWLHGGGFQFGSGADPKYDGAALAARGVVVVTLNYRLGAFGFLARTDLDQEAGSSGGYGLQDQIAALQWVQRNIASFGGDPRNVTLFGESAGGHSVGMLTSSAQTRGLFAKAIAQSGAFWDSQRGSMPTHAEALAHGNALAAKLDAPTLADLRAVPADWINAVTTAPGAAPFGPSVDGRVLTETPAAVFAAGRQQNVPLLAGYTGAENFPLFDPLALPHATTAEFFAAAEKLFGAERMAEFRLLYPATTAVEAKASAERLVGDMVITEQTWEMLILHSRTKDAPTYGYTFTYTSDYSPAPAHVADVPFVFGNLLPQFFAPSAPVPTAADRGFATTVMSYWTNFARTGDPNGPGLPAWPRYQGPGSVILDLKSAPAAVPEAATERLTFLASFRVEGRFPEAWRTAG